MAESPCLSGGNPVNLSDGNRCNPGFYCPNNTDLRPPQYCPPTPACQLTRLQAAANICAQPQGPFEPVVCPPGYYCPSGGQRQIECPSGHYCPLGSVAPTKCEALSVCPAGSIRELHLMGFLVCILIDAVLIGYWLGPRVKRWIGKLSRGKDGRENEEEGDVEMNTDEKRVGSSHASVECDNGGSSQGIEIGYAGLGLYHKATNNHILSGLSGTIAKGSLLGIMGPSGSGKSTFVNVISGKVKPTAGTVYLNGVPSTAANRKELVGFVPQDDLLHSDLTVRETILHSARIRLGRKHTDAHIQLHVDRLLDSLHLAKVAHHLIGDVARRGISGGERKRVSIAIELAASPMALILDEPTSGLDADAALSVMRLLKKLSERGTTIVCVIHQPRIEIFEVFDDLLILKTGRQAYAGKAAAAKECFAKMGFEFPVDSNPADIIIDIVSSREFFHHHPSSSPGTDSGSNITMVAGNASGLKQLCRSLSQRKAPWFCQMALCFARSMKQHGRHVFSLCLEIAASTLTGILIGLANYEFKGQLFTGLYLEPFERLSSAVSYTRIPEIALLCSLAISFAGCAPGVETFGAQKLIYYRESQSGHSESAYFAGKLLSSACRIVLAALHFTTLFAILATPRISFGMLFAINMLYFYCIYGLGSIVAALTKREDGPLMSMLGSLVIAAFGGYAPQLSRVKEWRMQWLWYLCPGTWFSEAYFNENTAPLAYLYNVPLAAKSTGYTTGRTGFDLGMLLLIGTWYWVVACVLLTVAARRHQG